MHCRNSLMAPAAHKRFLAAPAEPFVRLHTCCRTKVFNGGKVEHRKEKSATRRDESDEEIHQERRRVWQPCDSSLQRPTIPAIWASFQSEPVIGGTGWLKFMKVRFCMHATLCVDGWFSSSLVRKLTPHSFPCCLEQCLMWHAFYIKHCACFFFLCWIAAGQGRKCRATVPLQKAQTCPI